RAGGGAVLPIDSEHSAILQCLRGSRAEEVARILLTASGGPFVDTPAEEMAAMSPERALQHPTWRMGPKITIDSATLMNKGLEVIEAHHLFGLPGARIDVLVHPQSLVHSLVEFVDGSTLAQLGLPDMRTALAIGFAWPQRIDSGVAGLDLLAHPRLEFEAADTDAFPCLRLAYQALAAGGSAPAVLNASNEIAVSAFLQGRVGFLAISSLVEDALAAVPEVCANSLDALLDADRRARAHVISALSAHAAP
ncbi:MAG: 1-deoxy-D-xylulose-5-phosphate reductoisomerase, partial [Luteimonas sp.]